MCAGRDYETKFLVSLIADSYQEQIHLYHHVALREVWTLYAFRCCKNIYQYG